MLLLLLMQLRLLLCRGLLLCCCGLRRHLRGPLSTVDLCGGLVLGLCLKQVALLRPSTYMSRPVVGLLLSVATSELVTSVWVPVVLLSVGGASKKSVASLMLVLACVASSRAILCAALCVSPRRPPRRRVRLGCVTSFLRCQSGARSWALGPVGSKPCHGSVDA